MAERWSRLAVATEAVLFAVPVTSLAVFALVARVSFTGEQPRQIYDKAEAIVVALPIVPLCAGWVSGFALDQTGLMRFADSIPKECNPYSYAIYGPYYYWLESC